MTDSVECWAKKNELLEEKVKTSCWELQKEEEKKRYISENISFPQFFHTILFWYGKARRRHNRKWCGKSAWKLLLLLDDFSIVLANKGPEDSNLLPPAKQQMKFDMPRTWIINLLRQRKGKIQGFSCLGFNKLQLKLRFFLLNYSKKSELKPPNVAYRARNKRKMLDIELFSSGSWLSVTKTILIAWKVNLELVICIQLPSYNGVDLRF